MNLPVLEIVLFLGCGENDTGAAEDAAVNTAGDAAVSVAASSSGTVSGKCVKDTKVKGYKEAAADYEQKGLLDYSMDEDGGGEGGEPDENLLNVDEVVEMDTEPVGRIRLSRRNWFPVRSR